ncbi:MAG: hypothetical protein JW839_13045 [Candidatus Lokiarchaeota archaeon]|nr:hypothetical protein [Candidatus Lokiarchaeota archaeon]
MKINPPPVQFIVFSGGGGLVSRRQVVKIVPGLNTFDIDDVPAAFDPRTATVELLNAPAGMELVQLNVKRPDKSIMNQFIQREKGAATNIINAATDLRGQNREKIIQMIESTHYRAYEDVLGSFTAIISSKVEKEVDLEVRYFVEDARIKWEPSLHISIDKDAKAATIEGFIVVMNNSDFTYPQCELGFAEFELERQPDESGGYLNELQEEQAAQNIVPQSKMMQNLRRMKNLVL